MAQAKKSAPKLATSKVQSIGNRANKAAFTAVESSRASAENMVKMGSDSAREWMSSGAEEFQKAHEKLFAIGRETAANISRSAENASETVNEVIEQCKENIEAALEVSNLAINMSKAMSSEAINFANELFAENVETSKDLFSCRTVNDLFEIQSRALKSNLDSIFSQSMKMSEMLFEFASETAEPINERVSEAAERITKTFGAAA